MLANLRGVVVVVVVDHTTYLSVHYHQRYCPHHLHYHHRRRRRYTRTPATRLGCLVFVQDVMECKTRRQTLLHPRQPQRSGLYALWLVSLRLLCGYWIWPNCSGWPQLLHWLERCPYYPTSPQDIGTLNNDCLEQSTIVNCLQKVPCSSTWPQKCYSLHQVTFLSFTNKLKSPVSLIPFFMTLQSVTLTHLSPPEEYIQCTVVSCFCRLHFIIRPFPSRLLISVSFHSLMLVLYSWPWLQAAFDVYVGGGFRRDVENSSSNVIRYSSSCVRSSSPIRCRYLFEHGSFVSP